VLSFFLVFRRVPIFDLFFQTVLKEFYILGLLIPLFESADQSKG
jgi:hypothetical protein